MQKHYPITTQKFNGERFKDHGLDLDVLPELIAYKTLLIETAKALWRAKNPDRPRIKRNFEDGLKLKFYTIQPGSVAIPIEREYEVEESLFPIVRKPDELDEAAALLDEAMNAAAADQLLPAGFPKNVIPFFDDLGKTLREDESIEFSPARGGAKIIYTREVRDRLLKRSANEYSDQLNVHGEIRAASLDGNRFTVRQDDGTKVEGRFQPEQEVIVTDALREHVSCRVEIQGVGFFSADGILRRIDRVDRLVVRRLGEQSYDSTARPIWDVVEELGQSIPAEEWEKLPKDASINLDKYLYGKGESQP
ncbi:MAG: hypothetical protein COW13_00200 [Candidatus Omnitrophica bacterium CG12_big_fil_rev_8_21_14_0_65_50_5]|nr:MAG: hypothetical protein COW13_00200 [Candidatus Omnitrophica bacterium CG12_big_fil_rev_8_21_14_0_65_50_5]